MGSLSGFARPRVRFGWGPAGARALAPVSDVAVVVDVLSFTTTVSVALDFGITVLPYRWADEGAARYARRHGAVLATGRSCTGSASISLSPSSIRRAAMPPARVVLPSPNGATVAVETAKSAGCCVAACLRNATWVAGWICVRNPSSIAVIAAGERRSDGSLRRAEEDLWGAGALIGALARGGDYSLTAQAATARDAVAAVHDRQAEALLDTPSGRELADSGFGADVEIAAEVDASSLVPVLVGGAFSCAPRS